MKIRTDNQNFRLLRSSRYLDERTKRPDICAHAIVTSKRKCELQTAVFSNKLSNVERSKAKREENGGEQKRSLFP